MCKYYEQIDFYIGTVTTLLKGKSDLTYQALNMILGNIKQVSHGKVYIKSGYLQAANRHSSKLALCVATR